MPLLKFFHDPLALSDFQFNVLLSLIAGIFFLLPAVFLTYLLILTFKIESARTETQEP
jgi:hypothetical protein